MNVGDRVRAKRRPERESEYSGKARIERAAFNGRAGFIEDRGETCCRVRYGDGGNEGGAWWHPDELTPAPLTPRDVDPMVWAATFAAAFGVQAETAYQKCGEGPDRVGFALDTIDAARCRSFADAAVRALHPEAPAAEQPNADLERARDRYAELVALLPREQGDNEHDHAWNVHTLREMRHLWDVERKRAEGRHGPVMVARADEQETPR